MYITNAANPNIVKTALDNVFYPTFNESGMPGHASASDPLLFIQERSDKAAEIMELFAGSGEWTSRSELGNIQTGTPQFGNQKTFTHSNWSRQLKISKRFYDDSMFAAIDNMVRDFALKARITRDKTAFGVYRNSFTTELTADGVALFSNSHVTLGTGQTVDNLMTGALTYSNLNTAIRMLQEQLSQDGSIIGHVPAVLLVPPALRDTAERIIYSGLLPGSADNDTNAIRGLYNITVKTSPYLGAAAGGSDTAWFLLSRNHGIMRFVRQDVVTDMVDYKFSENNSYIYKGDYRESLGAMNWEGAVASTGLTA